MSMPGMMDTVLNIGLNDAVVEGLANLTGNERFAYDSYRRLINMFGDTVMGVDHEHFEHELSEVKNARGVKLDTDLSTEDLKEVVAALQEGLQATTSATTSPTDPYVQVERAIEAVFKSWMGDRAIRYRELNDIRGLRGTAVNVQSMVFGNMGDDSATGVAFTRNPSTGENKFYGEFLINAQGEDVVAGIRTPIPCEQMGQWSRKSWKELLEVKDILEARYKDVQDFEFTIEKGKLYMLQTRNGKRTTAAAVKIAVDMVKERPDRREDRRPARRPGEPGPIAAPDVQPQGRQDPDRQGPARIAGGGGGQDRLHRRGGRGARGEWREDHPGPARDRAGRHRRHARLRRHPDQHGRHDQPRRRRRPRHGHALRRRRRRRCTSTPAPRPFRSTARPTAPMTGFRWTAAWARSTRARSKRRKQRSAGRSGRSWNGPTSTGRSKCGPTPTPRTMPRWPATSALKASG